MLPAGDYMLDHADNRRDGDDGLPQLGSLIQIEGAGAGTTTIRRASGAAAFRLLHVSQTGTLDLNGVTLAGGDGDAAGGGGIYNQGRLEVNNGVVQGCAATDGGGLYMAEGEHGNPDQYASGRECGETPKVAGCLTQWGPPNCTVARSPETRARPTRAAFRRAAAA